MDLVVQVPVLPAAGETVLASDYQALPGGKGANQACAAGLLVNNDTQVAMVGCVGRDGFGVQLRESLSACHVNSDGVSTVEGVSGVAFIWVDRKGQNSIVVTLGANAHFRARDEYQGAAVALFQLENPLGEVEQSLRLAHAAKAITILDPAPAQPLLRETLENVDIFTPNETEAEAFAGPARSPIETAERLLELGPRSVILKLGPAGALYLDRKDTIIAPAYSVTALDTTAAGDCFNGALAVALAEGQSMTDALKFANAAASISVCRRGAQTSLPTRAEVDMLLRS
jgi:ribokinase